MSSKGKIASMFANLALVSTLLTACATAPQKPADLPRGDYSYVKAYGHWLVQREMKKNKVVGMSIALIDDQDVIWAEGFGYADKENNIASTPDTVYRIGSITKLFTSTSAMQLQEKGLLDIDAPLDRYLPEFNIRSRLKDTAPVTIRNLMTHHSGLPSDHLKGMWTTQPESFTHMVNYLRDEYMARPPGYVYSYSNVGMTLLGHAVQNAGGQAFNEYVAESILNPIGMNDSYLDSGLRSAPNASLGYKKGKPGVIVPLRDVPAGGMNTSALDLGRFLQMVFAGGRANGKQIIQTATLKEMLKPQNADNLLDFDFEVGLGWHLSGLGDIDIRNAGPVVHHSGGTLLFHSQLIAIPEHKLGIVTLANSAEARSAVDRVATEIIKRALEAKAGIVQSEREQVPLTAHIDPQLLNDYPGAYSSIVGLARINRVSSDRLQLHAFGQKFRLVNAGNGRLRMRYRLLGLIPINLEELSDVDLALKQVSGRSVLTASLYGKEIYAGEKLTPTPIPDAWRRREGKYRIVNAGDDHTLLKDVGLTIDDDLLVLDYRLPDLIGSQRQRLPLIAVSDTEAIIPGLSRGQGETLRIVRSTNGERLRYSGYLLEKK